MIYIVSLSVSLAIAMAWGFSPAPAEQPPLPEIARVAGQGRLDGVVIEYWVGGGPPPPLYRSDRFRLFTVGESDVLEFARPYRDPASKREGLVEKFQLPAQPADIRKLAKLILDTGVFARHIADEDDPGRADILTTEVIVRAAGREFKRRYFTASPKPLEPLRAEVERLVQRLTAGGKREVIFQSKPLAAVQEPSREDTGGAGADAGTVPLPKLAEEVGRRIGGRLSTQGRLVLWLSVSENDPAREAAREVKRVLETLPGLVFSTKKVAGTEPVPSGTPGGHVNMLVYAVEPHPDSVLAVYEMNGRVCASERDAGKDPLAPTAVWNWTLCAR